jgi:hypothetical protein
MWDLDDYPPLRRPPKPAPSLGKWIGLSALLVVLLAAIGIWIVFSLLPPSAAQVNHLAAARAQSQNNLKQIGIGLHNIASVHNGLEPPVVGQFPLDGYSGTIFFHLLPHIEQDNIYKLVTQASPPPGNMTLINRSNGGIAIYNAPGDPSSEGSYRMPNSYCANGAVFDGKHGGSVRFPSIFGAKGAVNCILVFERFATAGTRTRLWPDAAPYCNWLYSPYDGGGFDTFPYHAQPADASAQTGFFDRYGNDGEVDFGKTPANVSHVNKPHAFNAASINVLLGDGSARSVNTSVNGTFDVDGRQVRIWAWACSVHGTFGKSLMPSGW